MSHTAAARRRGVSVTEGPVCAAHEKVLLIARAGEIRGVDLEAPQVHMIPTVSGAHVTAPAALQYEAGARRIYWADTETSEIKSAALTGGAVRVLADSGVRQPRGFALDWAAGVLYYSSGAALLAASLAGEHTLLLRELANVSALAVDPRRGRLYWAAQEPDAERITQADGAAEHARPLLDSLTEPLLSGVTSECFSPSPPPPCRTGLRPLTLRSCCRFVCGPGRGPAVLGEHWVVEHAVHRHRHR